MSDFDERLSAVLSSEAGDAPPAAGLADAARRRHVVRRRRRVAVGGVAAALAIAVPVLVLAGGDGDGDAVVGADSPPGAWQTIAQGDVRVEVPADWRKYTCDFDGFESDAYGPSEADACGFGSYLAFYASATFDAAHSPGVITAGKEDEPRWSGYVYADELAVSSATEDRDLTRRILASAQVDGQPDVEVAEWATLDGVGMRVDVPDHWGLGPDADLRSYAVCASPGDADDPPKIERQQGAEGAYVGLDHRGGRWVSVAAPTAAIGDLVLASVEAAPGSTAIGCIPEDFGPGDDPTPTGSNDEWQAVEVEGVQLDVPAHWFELDCPAETGTYGPGAGPCGRGEYVTLHAAAIFDPAMGPGEIIAGDEDGKTLWTGYVVAGDWAVLVRTFERQLTEDILATVRP